jgi:hypothetical protein
MAKNVISAFKSAKRLKEINEEPSGSLSSSRDGAGDINLGFLDGKSTKIKGLMG